METIRNYVENMFAVLPRSEELTKLKGEILMNLEDRYKELRSQGMSENESIGAVISEFGSLDELLEELGLKEDLNNKIDYELVKDNKPTLDRNSLYDYLGVLKQSSVLIGAGVFLIIAGVSLFLLLSGIFGIWGDVSAIYLVPLLLAVAVAVGMFIFGGSRLESFKFIEMGNFTLTYDIRSEVEELYQENQPRSMILIIMGVCLCVVSVVFLLIGTAFGRVGSTLGLCLMLLLVAVGVFLFIYNGIYTDGLKGLLGIKERCDEVYKNPKEENMERMIGAVSAVFWPVIVCVFLYCGFFLNMWGICWIIFPFAGLLFGAFTGAYRILKGKKD